MSTFAKKQMAKMGWKEGEGLGKNGEGVATYVHVSRSSLNGRGEFVGVGHSACSNASPVVDDMGYGDTLKDIGKKKTKKDDSSSSDSSDSDKKPPRPEKKVATTKPTEEASGNKKRERETVVEGKHKGEASSSSDSEASNDGGEEGDVLYNDAKLFERCGGVRLGRAGRHRLFDAKLQRVEDSHAKHAKAEK